MTFEVPDWLDLGIIIASALAASTALVGMMPVVPSNRLSNLARWMMRVGILIAIVHVAAMFVFGTEDGTGGGGGGTDPGNGLDLAVMAFVMALEATFIALLVNYIVIVTRARPLLENRMTLVYIYGLPALGLTGFLVVASFDLMGWGAVPTASLGYVVPLLQAIGGAMVLALTYDASWSRLPDTASGMAVWAGFALAAVLSILVLGIALAPEMDAFALPPLRMHPNIAMMGLASSTAPAIASLIIASNLAGARAFIVEGLPKMRSRSTVKGLEKGAMFYIDGKRETDLDMAFETLRTEARNGRPCVVITGRRLGSMRERFQLRKVVLVRATKRPVGGQLSLEDPSHLEMVPTMASDFSSENKDAVVVVDVLSEYLHAGHTRTATKAIKALEKMARSNGSTVIITLRTKDAGKVMATVRRLASPL